MPYHTIDFVEAQRSGPNYRPSVQAVNILFRSGNSFVKKMEHFQSKIRSMLAIDWLNGGEVTKAVELTQDENLTIRLENIQNQAFQLLAIGW